MLRCTKWAKIAQKRSLNHKKHYSLFFSAKNQTSPNKVKQSINEKLNCLITAKTDSKIIYKYIINNYNSINHQNIEVCLFNLINQNYIPASSTLLHYMFEKDATFTLSNELWSTYINQICSTANHLGAVLIYHQLVDNYKFYHSNSNSALLPDNNLVPFLLTPSTILTLSSIFKQNSDPIRCNGLFLYFKRFYSYLNDSIYKQLRIILIEAYALVNNLEMSLSLFNKLSFAMKGSFDSKNWIILNSKLKQAAFTTYRQRRINIKDNLKLNYDFPKSILSDLDKLQLKTVDNDFNKLFNPIIERNVYANTEIKSIPIINGHLYLKDFLILSKLVSNYIIDLKIQNNTSHLINFITSNHSLTQLFVANTLCQLGLIKHAIEILKKLPYEYKLINPNVLISNDNFIIILDAIKKKSRIDHMDLIKTLLTFYHDLNDFGCPRIYEKFTSCLLSVSGITGDDLIQVIKAFRSKERIRLSGDDYTKISNLLDGEFMNTFTKRHNEGE